ncbi:MAG: SMP-30/gluconolactonase/LRE family protein [Burkholderiaceae bacterium]|nr:SMP-30/gluconolactonase/LRE family protein [Burkholderiaceae bacterium]
MKTTLVAALALATLAGCASLPPAPPTVSILVDLDPASVDRTVIVENITADRNGMLYTGDRVSGNILRIDPRDPRPVIVGRMEPRQVNNQPVPANASGMAFTAQGDLLIVAAGFGEVMRLRAAELDPARPGIAQTFAAGMPGANGLALDAQGQAYVAGGGSGTIFRVGPGGGAALPVAQIERFSRTLPDSRTQQAIVANGLAFDARGVLHVADTARGAIWKVSIGADAKAAAPTLLVQNPVLEGADGIAFDQRGNLWVAVNELNALVMVTPDGQPATRASNGSAGPLEFPGGIVFVGETAYVTNFDVPRRVNMDAGANTALAGIGASIVRVQR